MERRVSYSEAEADALVAEAKRHSKETGRSVRAEAELLLSKDRDGRLRDLRTKVAAASELLAAVIVEVDDLRAGSGDDDGDLADIVATMAAACAPFTSTARGSSSTPTPGWATATIDPSDGPDEGARGAPS